MHPSGHAIGGPGTPTGAGLAWGRGVWLSVRRTAEQWGQQVSDFDSLLSDTREGIATAELVLSEIDRGLAVVEKVDAVARRTRPALRVVTVMFLGCLVGLGIVLLVGRIRRAYEIDAPRPGDPPLRTEREDADP